MHLLLINGSPRGSKSNSRFLLQYFLRGFESESSNSAELLNLTEFKEFPAIQEKFLQADVVFIGFPLYTDAMPGLMMQFIESLQVLRVQTPNLKKSKIGFLVQSGFPETIHCVTVEKYMKKLISRLGCEYIGSVILSGVEGIQMMPEKYAQTTTSAFVELGKKFAESGVIDPSIMKIVKRPIRFSKSQLFEIRIINALGLTNMYWNSALKQNGAYSHRYDRPYRP